MLFRLMTIVDYDAVTSLWQNTAGVRLRDADSREGIERYLARNPSLNFVALDGDAVVGTIMAGHDGRRGYIQHLAVLPKMRNQGVASKLLELCLEALNSESIEKSHIHVLVENHDVKQFWLNRGWTFRDDIETYSYTNSSNNNA